MITVLICDSLADNRQIIRQLLAVNANWTIVESDSASEVFRILAEQDVAVLITDLHVSDGSGKSFVEVLRARFPQLPTVVISPAGPDKAVVRALVLGAVAYVARTVLARDLCGTIERLVALLEPLPAWDRLRTDWVETTVRFLLPSDRACLRSAVQHLQADMSPYDILGPADRTRLGMALSEALANAMIHGNLELSSELREKDPVLFEHEILTRSAASPFCDRRVQVTACFSPAGATFVIRDEGTGFDVRSVPDPTDEVNILKLTGRGLLLMRAFMDELTFNEVGNEVTMKVRAKDRNVNASTG